MRTTLFGLVLLLIGSAPAAEPPTPARAIAREQLRYDGKSFAQWQNQARTELKPLRCAEALEALAVFGTNGYGREASRTIVAVAKRLLRREKPSGSDEKGVIEVAGAAICRIGKPAAPALVRCLGDPNACVVGFAVSLLADFDQSPRSALPGLIDAVLHKDLKIARSALLALMKVEGAASTYQAALKAAGKTERFVAALAAIVKPAKETDEQWGDPAAAAIILLAGLGSEARPAIGALLARFQKPDNPFRVPLRPAAAGALGVIHCEPETVIPALLRVVQNSEEDEDVRCSAAMALVGFGSHAKGAVPTLRELSRARTISNRGSAMATILAPPVRQTAEPPAIVPQPASETPATAKPKREETPKIKLTAAVVLDRLQAGNSTAGPVLLGLLADLKEHDDRGRILEEVSRPEMRSVVPALLKAFDRYQADRALIAVSLGKIGPGAKEALPVLMRARKDGNEDLRRAAAAAIEAIAGKR